MFEVKMYEAHDVRVELGELDECNVYFIHGQKGDPDYCYFEVHESDIRECQEVGRDLIVPAMQGNWLYMDVCELDDLIQTLDDRIEALEDPDIQEFIDSLPEDVEED